MFLEKKIVAQPIPYPITTSIAQEIYGEIKKEVDVSRAYSTLSKYEWVYFLDVANEIEALEQIANEEMNRPKEQPAPVIDPETGEEVQKTIILRPTTREELLARLESDILDVDIFLTDFMDYVLCYKEGTTREDFADQFISSPV